MNDKGEREGEKKGRGATMLRMILKCTDTHPIECRTVACAGGQPKTMTRSPGDMDEDATRIFLLRHKIQQSAGQQALLSEILMGGVPEA